MIPVPSQVRIWLAVGRTDMRRGMQGLALQVQETLGRDPHADDLYVFRGRSGNLIKIIWHDGLGMSLYAKRLEKGRFLWPSLADGTVSISPSQLAYMLDWIDWRNPRHTFRPQRAGWVLPRLCAIFRESADAIYDSFGAWMPPPWMLFRTISAR
jgi:transposase